ncbi:putative DNA endonuclease SmrA [Pigmentiphaga humi]|uniref:Putative DNA endonuclease SmrA n=1 Tax=Pigmentiphaga humi TaxID=2478468 RepID=A0A3P4B8W6_9BURK|nr:Smr/MutS family protein [Pigmentiphaga humi]VCU71595.1 putative DNA endonuclease SmrA [Pigmentiphaga humi]
MSGKPVRTGLAGLKALQRELQERRAAAEAAEREARRRAAEARRAAAEFRSLVGEVVQLKPDGRVDPAPASPPPLPYKRWEDDSEVLRESVSDEYGADWLIETDDTLSYRRSGLGQDVVRKLRRGQWTVQSQLDLHGYRVEEAREALGEFLRACVKQEMRCVRIIHGKGLGSKNRTPILKEKVRRWLVQKEEVLAFVEARPTDGGAGVVLVLLHHAARPA